MAASLAKMECQSRESAQCPVRPTLPTSKGRTGSGQQCCAKRSICEAGSLLPHLTSLVGEELKLSRHSFEPESLLIPLPRIETSYYFTSGNFADVRSLLVWQHTESQHLCELQLHSILQS